MDSDTKHCPTCDQDLPINGFGICRARKDGRNFYCMACIRLKMNKCRQGLREHKAARRARVRSQALVRTASDSDRIQVQTPQPTKDSPDFLKNSRFTLTDRVLAAIGQGARTYGEILGMVQNRYTSKDEIGEALATLLLDTHEIRTETDSESRLYFIAKPKTSRQAATSVGSTSWRPMRGSWLHLVTPVVRGAQR